MSQIEQPPVSARERPATFGPAGGDERVELLDILRGFAVFGILLVNQQLFFAPLYLVASGTEWWSSGIDVAVERAIMFLAQGKFYALFSMLFGIGMAIQMERAERSDGRSFGSFFARRMFWLLVIGASHALLIWFGDILLMYALIGFALILFRKRSNVTLLVWTVVLLLAPLVLLGGIVGALELAKLVPEASGEIADSFAQNKQQTQEALERAVLAYSSGSLAEIFRVRLGQLGVLYSYSLLFFPNILGIFLIGLNLGRRRFFRDVESWLPLIRRWIGWFLGVGVVGNLASVVLQERLDPGVPSPGTVLQQLVQTVSAPALMFFYVSAITLLAQREAWRRRLSPLAAVGRMALTNYLMHSLVFTTLANSYGFGLYGRVRPIQGLALAFATYVIQIPLSVWWLNRFRFGPMEWLWRSLTYGRPQPMRR